MKKTAVVLVLIMAQWGPLLGQDKKLFEGEYEFNGKAGLASFEYVENKSGDIVLHGKFGFDRKYIDSLDKTVLSKLRVRGTYDNNRKVGEWLYDQEYHQIFLNDVENFEVNTSLESEDLELKASYKNNLPHGEWNYQENIFSRGRLESKFVAEPIQFDEGVITGEVLFKEFDDLNTYSIKGKLTKNGVMEGNWVFVYNEEERVRNPKI